MTVSGPTAGLTISGNGLSGVFEVDQGVTASISGSRSRKGALPAAAGVYNQGTTQLTDCIVSGNSAAGTAAASLTAARSFSPIAR